MTAKLASMATLLLVFFSQAKTASANAGAEANGATCVMELRGTRSRFNINRPIFALQDGGNGSMYTYFSRPIELYCPVLFPPDPNQQIPNQRHTLSAVTTSASSSVKIELVFVNLSGTTTVVATLNSSPSNTPVFSTTTFFHTFTDAEVDLAYWLIRVTIAGSPSSPQVFHGAYVN